MNRIYLDSASVIGYWVTVMLRAGMCSSDFCVAVFHKRIHRITLRGL
jgi:hypothetical protein